MSISEIETSVLEVDGKLASVYLEKNNKNRTLNKNRVKKYAVQMQANQWRLNGEPIIIGKNGELLDGQHRLEAVKRSKAKVNLLFCFNVEPEYFDTINTGDSRTGADVLSIEGMPDHKAKMLSVAIRNDLLMMYTGKPLSSSWLQGRLTPHSISQANKNEPDYLKAVDFISGYKSRNLILSGSSLAFLSYRFFKIDEEFSKPWVNGLITGVGLVEDDNRLWIREQFVKDMKRSAKRAVRVKMGMIIKAWNHDRRGRNISNKYSLVNNAMDAYKYIVLDSDEEKAKNFMQNL